MRRNKVDRRVTRPFFCYDKKCKIIYSTFDKTAHNDGFSFFCYGKLLRPHVFVEKKTKHVNDICHCYYTPLKGAVRYFTCHGDLWGEANALCAVMNRLKKDKCAKCKGKTVKMIIHKCFMCNKEV